MNEETKARIDQVNEDIQSCPDCPYLLHPINKGDRELLWGEGSEIMFIGQAPAQSSSRKKGSRFDSLLFDLLTEVAGSFHSPLGITEGQICFTNVCKASMPPGAVMSVEQREHCYAHVTDEVIAVRPKLIITLGALARDWAGGKFDSGLVGDFPVVDQGITKRLQIPIYSMVHPGVLNYGRISRSEVIRQLKNAINYEHESRGTSELANAEHEVHKD